jgi:ABC-type amino acid transport system permease subunit
VGWAALHQLAGGQAGDPLRGGVPQPPSPAHHRVRLLRRAPPPAGTRTGHPLRPVRHQQPADHRPRVRGRRRSGTLWWLVVLAGLALALGVATWRTRRSDVTGQPHHRVAWAGGALATVAITAFVLLDRPIGTIPTLDGRVVEGGLSGLGAFFAVMGALVVYTASHVAEIVRGSIQAVPAGQTEAANALALSGFQRLRFVVLPQAFRIAIPPVINQYLNYVKNTSLAIAIGYAEVTAIAIQAIGNGQSRPPAHPAGDGGVPALLPLHLTRRQHAEPATPVRDALMAAPTATEPEIPTRPPAPHASPGRWVRTHLFRTWYDGLFTLLFGGLALWAGAAAARFLAGADFTILRVNLALFMVGRFPRDQLWRPAVALVLLAILAGFLLGVATASARARALESGIPFQAATPMGLVARFWPALATVGMILLLTETPGPALAVTGAFVAGIAARLAAGRAPAWLRGCPGDLPGPRRRGRHLEQLGRAAPQPVPHHRRDPLRIPARPPARPRPAVVAPGRPLDVGHLHRADPGRAPHHPPAHGGLRPRLLPPRHPPPRADRPGARSPSRCSRPPTSPRWCGGAAGGAARPGRGLPGAGDAGVEDTRRSSCSPRRCGQPSRRWSGSSSASTRTRPWSSSSASSTCSRSARVANSQPASWPGAAGRSPWRSPALLFWVGSYVMSREARRLEKRLGVGER